jgi:hypothetical protein
MEAEIGLHFSGLGAIVDFYDEEGLPSDFVRWNF